MIENISFISDKGFVAKGSFHSRDSLLVLSESKVSQALLVKHLWITRVDLQSTGQIIDAHLIVTHVKVTLRSILQELNVLTLSCDRVIKGLYSFNVILQLVITLAEPVMDRWFGLDCSRTFEVSDCLRYLPRLQTGSRHVKHCIL